MTRCLILSCSETKNNNPDDLPAIKRYNGPVFRVLRKYLDGCTNTEQPDVYILSAKFGLIAGDKLIPDYDQSMTTTRARELNAQVLADLKATITPQKYSELFLSMGKTYLAAMSGYQTVLGNDTTIILATGGSGGKQTELKRWLYGTQAPAPASQPNVIEPKTSGRPVVLKGKKLDFTSAQVYQAARLALKAKNNSADAQNYKNWYVLIDGVKVAPKWLVSQLSEVPVSAFDASAARRVLSGLGVRVYRI